MISVAYMTTVAVYMNFFKAYVLWLAGGTEQWMFALGALILVLAMNMLPVKVFRELEFWFSVIKALALLIFLAIGIWFVLTGTPIDRHVLSFSTITEFGGFFPDGALSAGIVVQGVVFA